MDLLRKLHPYLQEVHIVKLVFVIAFNHTEGALAGTKENAARVRQLQRPDDAHTLKQPTFYC
jgi:hypothetical protein